jgi:hypothetical protein
MDAGTGGGIAGSGGGPGSANIVTGRVNGRAITAASAAAQRIMVLQTSVSSSVTHEGLVVRLSESSAVCNTSGAVGVAGTDKRVVTLRIDLAPDAGVGNGQFTGSLSIAVPDCSMATASGSGPVSMLQQFEQSSSASITLTETTAKVRGTFTATLSSGAPISGSFDADFCNFYEWEIPGRVQCK